MTSSKNPTPFKGGSIRERTKRIIGVQKGKGRPTKAEKKSDNM